MSINNIYIGYGVEVKIDAWWVELPDNNKYIYF